jgi:hypothetical protein
MERISDYKPRLVITVIESHVYMPGSDGITIFNNLVEFTVPTLNSRSVWGYTTNNNGIARRYFTDAGLRRINTIFETMEETGRYRLSMLKGAQPRTAADVRHEMDSPHWAETNITLERMYFKLLQNMEWPKSINPSATAGRMFEKSGF